MNITRRFFVQASLLVGALAFLPKVAHAFATSTEDARDETNAPPRRAPCPVVAFHMDQPYIDYSGTAEPYLPPAGARSAEHLALLDDEAIATLRL